MSRPPSSALSIPLPASRSPSISPPSASRESRISFEEPPEWNVQHEPTQNFSTSDYLNAVEPPIVPTPRPFSTASHRSSLIPAYPPSRHSTIRTLPFPPPPPCTIIEPPSDSVGSSQHASPSIPSSLSSSRIPSDLRRCPSPRSEIYIVPSLPPLDPHPSNEIEMVAMEGKGSTASSAAGANVAPHPPPTQAWVIEKPPSPVQLPGFIRRIVDRIMNSPIMCSCL